MRILIKLTCGFFLALIMLNSCQQQEEPKCTTCTTASINYEVLSKELSSSLNQIANDLRSNNSNFTDIEQVSLSAQSVLEFSYKTESNVFSTFSDSYEQSMLISGVHTNASARQQPETVYLSKFQYYFLEKVDLLWKNAESSNSYHTDLSNLFDEMYSSNTEQSDKEWALIYLTSQLVAIDFIQKNIDLLGSVTQTNSRIQGWWNNWGKCAAGIIGGATGGALVEQK